MFFDSLLALVVSDNMASVYCTEIKHKLYEYWSIKNHLKAILIDKACFFKQSILLKDLMSALYWGHEISGFAPGRSVSNILKKTWPP